MKPLRVHLIAGARPNFMKIAPLWHALKKEDWCRPAIVHTGQHYDENLSNLILNNLGMPEPNYSLAVGSGSHAAQTAAVMVAYEEVCLEDKPDWVVVVGDVNSTLAATLTAKKLNLNVAHLEAGLRSRDRTMPEELNRIATDALADLLWTPSPDADDNLLAEGVAPERIERVGNIMIDSFEMMRAKIDAVDINQAYGLKADGYGIVTLHRPSNVDKLENLSPIVDALCEIARDLKLVFPLHPRTRQALEKFDLLHKLEDVGIELLAPLGYVHFMALVRHARLAITDSGGIQEETTYLGIPCFTLRANTERPITLTQGTNLLVDAKCLVPAVSAAVTKSELSLAKPELWDGKTAERVAGSLRKRHLESASQFQ